MDSGTVLKRFTADIDVKRTVAIRPFTVVEGDTGNVLTLTVSDGNDPVDLTGCFAAAVFSHSRGISEQDSSGGGITIDGSELEIALLPSSFAPGMVECEVQIYSGGIADTSRVLITTAKFNFVCRRAIINVDSIQTTPQFPLLTGLIDSIEAAEAERAANEDARQTAEALRETAENARAAAEASRASAEQGRASAELDRASAENERAYAEITRTAAEAGRASAESDRALAENARALAESAREAASASAVSAASSAAAAATAAAELIYDISLTPDSAEGVERLVRAGLHAAIPVGAQYEAYRTTGVTVSVYGSGISAASADEGVFTAKAGSSPGIYRFISSGGKWYLFNIDGAEASLSEYGITVTGTPADGDGITVTVTARRLALEVADHDKCCGGDENSVVFTTPVLCYDFIPFSAPQLMIFAEAKLPPGRYRFTLDHGAFGGNTGADGHYVFTISSAVPAGGGIRHSAAGAYHEPSVGYKKSQIIGNKLTTYGDQPQRTVIESDIAVSEWDGAEECTYLGKVTARDSQYLSGVSGLTAVNYTERNYYGSNRYAHSAIRKWLNSEGKAVKSGDTTFSYWWTPSDEFDMPPSLSACRSKGFLYGFDPELAGRLGEANVVVELPGPERTVNNSAFTETLHDKVFLLSKTEVYGGTNINSKEGEQLAVYAGTGNSGKVKYYYSTAKHWWLRSAKNDTEAGYGRYVTSAGALNHIYMSSQLGVAAGMIIKAPKGE